MPPLSEKPLRLPLAPPLDQRSCCQLPTRLLASARLTSTHGSTSALRYTVPVWGAPSHPAANGLGPLTSVRGSTAADGGGRSRRCCDQQGRENRPTGGCCEHDALLPRAASALSPAEVRVSATVPPATKPSKGNRATAAASYQAQVRRPPPASVRIIDEASYVAMHISAAVLPPAAAAAPPDQTAAVLPSRSRERPASRIGRPAGRSPGVWWRVIRACAAPASVRSRSDGLTAPIHARQRRRSRSAEAQSHCRFSHPATVSVSACATLAAGDLRAPGPASARRSLCREPGVSSMSAPITW